MQEPVITTAVKPENSNDCLTIDKLRETMREGQKKIDDMNDKLVEALLLGGFKVQVVKGMPSDMIAILPGDFQGSLDRLKAKLRDDPRQFGVIRNLV